MRQAQGFIASWLARWLSAESIDTDTSPATETGLLERSMRPGDVLLVEGHSRISTAIKYLTQSTWSHSALYVGDATGRFGVDGRPLCFIEADIVEGVRAVGFDQFAGFHCRICRPVRLTDEDRHRLIVTAMARLGDRYDLKNVVDLARYLIPTPPVPVRWRRRLLSLGSGDPTRVICSTLVAQCFQCIAYPILPRVVRLSAENPSCPDCTVEVLQSRHHSLFVPRDFDVSPYFEVVKPTLVAGFDYRRAEWLDERHSLTETQQ